MRRSTLVPDAARFPHESSGIKSFYNECWSVFNALNSLELKSLEEPRCVCVGGGEACAVLDVCLHICCKLHCAPVISKLLSH